MRQLGPLALVVALLVAFGGCRKSDAQRAKEERAEVEKKLRESLTLFPYRLLKIAVRSAKSPNRPAAVDAVVKVLEETQALPSKPATAEEAAQEALVYARLLKALFEARESMMSRDEDEFPTVLDQFSPGAIQSPPYDPQLEHLMLAVFWFVVDSADRGGKVPGGAEYVFYELSRATPQPGWTPAMRGGAQILRGASFCATKYHHAAEEELTQAIAGLEKATPADFADLGGKGVEPEHELRAFRAAAHFARAWNRLGLKREEGATEDLESALAELKAMGIDNELTQWAWAVVHAHRGRYPEAAAELDKLAQSPNLDAETRADLTAAAKDMRANGHGVPVFLETRAMLIVGEALLARSGGVEAVLKVVLGEEKGKQLAEQLSWLQRTRRALGQSPAAAWEKGKAWGGAGLEAVKHRVEQLRAAPDAGPADPR